MSENNHRVNVAEPSTMKSGTRSPCDECAFSNKGAGLEPYNSLRGRICALGPIPFGCHHGLDWHGSSSWSAAQAREALRTSGICEGWRAEVQRLNRNGWYGKYRIIRRAVAKSALVLVELFTAASDNRKPVEKKRYLISLKRHLRFLSSRDIEHKKLPFDLHAY